jgi:asparagine synthase (glutamine-hydrolysing)
MMCGIAGFIGRGSFVDLHIMIDSLKHRGPDGEGVWSNPEQGVFLGHRRLAIIDAAGGAQPMATPDGRLVVVYNGEIYNHAELRAQLESLGHRFQSDHCDTEVLLHGYRQWGDDLPTHLNGMWAFAIYDCDRREMFLSRDRFGQKPLFYTFQNATFAFASELSSLIRHSHVSSSVSLLSVQKYFAYGFIPAPHSLYESIRKLPGGHNLFVEAGRPAPVVRPYWDFRLDPSNHLAERTEADLAEELRSLLRNAVARHLMSDVPVGLFLSGGLDSSTITRFATESSSARPVWSYCVGFDAREFDESAHAALVAQTFRTQHVRASLTATEFEPLAREIAERVDEPQSDSSLVPTTLLCRTAGRNVTVALGGDGADELFCGYDTFRAVRLAQFYAKIIPRPMHEAVRMALALLPTRYGYMSFDFRIKRLLRGLSYRPEFWNPVWLGPLGPAEFVECFFKPVDPESLYSEAIDLWEGCGSEHIIDRTTQFYVKLYLQDGILAKLDRAGMWNSLEVRSPFLDIELVDFIRRLPRRMKFHKSQTKYLLRQAMRPLLPRSVLSRKKHGFPFPAAQWLRNGILREDSFQPICGQRPEFAKQRWRRHENGQSDERLFLWSQWVLWQSLSIGRKASNGR